MKPIHFVLLLFAIALCVSETDAQWVHTNGPEGGGIFCFAVSGTSLFAGTSGGIFLSTDNGTCWTAVNSGLTRSFIRASAVSGTNLFAGTSGGVFLSTNIGTSWTAVDSGLTNPYVDAFAVSGTNLFAGTLGSGVFRSTDNGSSWKYAGMPNCYVISLAVSGTTLVGGTAYGGGAFVSTNDGISWTPFNTGLPNTTDGLLP